MAMAMLRLARPPNVSGWRRLRQGLYQLQPRGQLQHSVRGISISGGRLYSGVPAGKGAAGAVSRFLKRQVYLVLLVGGFSAGALLLVYVGMRREVERLSWLENYLPSSVGGKIANGLDSLSGWLKTSPTASNSQSSPSSSSSSSSTTPSSTSSKTGGVSETRDRLLHSEIKEVQSKLAQVEKENHELRQLLKASGDDARAALLTRQKSLIEMYTDILNLLTDFDAKLNRKDGKFVNTLPQVVVVGDQSAGKTSVLEMVANARIFPRGGGEMMTRSPVIVTLSEGPEHVALFKDSTKVYDLSKEDDLTILRREIEQRMKRSVENGKTISTEPVSLVVYGPQLKRMVLVDLPGIISTVTTGMAATTREEIIRLCRQYMANPNAIIMCIQDGSVDAERSIVTDLVGQMDPPGRRTIFVLTKVDMAERSGIKQQRMLSILDGQLFPMQALGYYAVVTGKGSSAESINTIQHYEREYFAKSKLFQNGMLREAQLSTRNMVNAVTEEFWKMVTTSINDQALHFKTLRYNLEAEWRNRYPGGRTLDRNDLFELGKADILNHVASLQVFKPSLCEPSEHVYVVRIGIQRNMKVKLQFLKCIDMMGDYLCHPYILRPYRETVLMDSLWKEMAPHVLDIFIEAAQGQSPGEFNTSADIQLHKWADSHQLAELCAKVGLETMFDQLHTKLEGQEGGGPGGGGGGGWGVVGGGGGGLGGGAGAGKFHSLGQGLREEVERLSKQNHHWESYNVDQLKYVQMSALDDKDVPSAEQWKNAVSFMTSALSLQIKEAEGSMQKLTGATSFYDRWILWKSTSNIQVVKNAAVEELKKFLVAEPTHPSKLFTDELMTVQRVLKNQGHKASEEDIQESWRHVYHLHFLKKAEETAQKCQRGFVLRQHSPEYACPEVEYFWRVQQVMKSSAHTLRVQILDREVRQLEQQIKSILNSIAVSEEKKKELIRGDAVDKAEQLKQVRMIQEKLDTFRDALSKQQKGHSPK